MKNNCLKNIFLFLYEKSVLIGPMGFILFMNFKGLVNPFIPCCDTLFIYENFNFFYNEYFLNGNIAQWMPNNSFGMPTSYIQLFGLAPSSYFMFVFGKLFNILDSAVLFKFSIIIDQFILLLGTYLLSKQLFKSKFSSIIVCTSVVCNSMWDGSIDFHLRLFYLLPLTMYFFLMFHKNRWAGYLGLALITVLLSVTGNNLYFFPLYVFVLFFFNLFLLRLYKPSWKFFNLNLSQVVVFVIFILLLYCLYHQLSFFRSFVDTPYRENGQKNTLYTFLTYWNVPPATLENFLTFNFFGRIREFYMGILLSLFLIFALFVARSGSFFVFLFSALVILWLACGGVFSTISYYFPGMAYFRHITHTYGIYNLLFIFCAGFGIEEFLKLTTKIQIRMLLLMPIVLVFILDVLDLRLSWVPLISSYHSLVDFLWNLKISDAYFRLGIHLIVPILILPLLCMRLKDDFSQRWIKIVLMVVFMFDMYSYVGMHRIQPRVNDDKLSYVMRVNKLEYQPYRHNSPENTLEENVMSLPELHGGGYEALYNIAQFSPCNVPPQIRRDFIPKRFGELSKLESDVSKSNFNIITACESSKLRLMSSSIVEGRSSAKDLFKLIPDFSKSFILTNQKTEVLNNPFYGSDGKIEDNSIFVKKYTTDSITVETDVLSARGAWLVYADSFHLGWKAKVNGKYKETFPANIAFKAVHLDQGHNVVEWRFDHWPSRMASYFIALVSFIFAVLLCGWFLKELCFYSKERLG